MQYSHLTTIDGSWLYTSDGSPIVVAIVDPLDISCPANINITTPISGSKDITWPNPTATGGVPPYTFTSTPASGSSFSLGSTIVNCSVEDSLGNTDSCSFTVTITLMAATGCNTGLSNGFTQ